MLGRSERVDSARREALEKRDLGRLLINMKWLRIKHCGKRNNFVPCDHATAAHEDLTWREVVQPQQ